MISKELLNEVLVDKDIQYVKVINTTIYFNQQINDDGTYKMAFAWEDTCINIYELASKCKEWAYKQRYYLLSGKSKFDGYKCFDDQGKISTFTSYKSEQETVIQACEWIFNEIIRKNN